MILTAPPDADALPGPFVTATVAGALRRVESAGALDDALALQRAFAAGGDRAAQVKRRNTLLAERLGLLQALARWRVAGIWLLLVLALLMALAGLTVARGVLVPDRSVNAVAAVVGVLALPTLTLLLWLLGLAVRWRRPDAPAWSFGHLLLSLLSCLPLGAGPHARALLHALLEVMKRQRLWPWFSGLVSHAVWLLALLLTLLALVGGFAFRAYQLSWETTILSTGFFQGFVAITGWLPQWLGFPVPDAAAVRQVAHAGAPLAVDAGIQSAWAWWLVGCVLVYGLLPRLALLALSAWRWHAGLARLSALDLADPYNQALVRRLDALEPAPQVIDPEQGVPAQSTAHGLPQAAASGAPWVLAFELPALSGWPPAGARPLPAAQPVDGGSAARQQVRRQLATAPPPAVLVLLHAPASPDRGTARFLRELGQAVPRCAVLPLQADGSAGAPAALARWRDWLQAQRLDAVVFLQQPAQARSWLEHCAGDAGQGGHG